MPTSCSIIKHEVKDVVTMNQESYIKMFVLNDGCDVMKNETLSNSSLIRWSLVDYKYVQETIITQHLKGKTIILFN
jgi:hypothetical protein